MENTIRKLETETECKNKNNELELFEIALGLNITWLNRILFLKLLEAKLASIHNGDYPHFLSFETVREFDNLNTLFFEVLAIDKPERKAIFIDDFKDVPYLNSALFETTELESDYLRISNLKDNAKIKVLSTSVLTQHRSEELNTLEYLLKFLSAYDFATDAGAEFKNEHTLINASVLGLIFEKLNGYKDGSFYTPSFITMYMTRQTIRQAVVAKFNDVLKDEKIVFDNFNELKNYCDNNYFKDAFINKANKILDSITIVDPAVGSGHFLVSALNELLVIKNELKVLRGLNAYNVTNENDELYVEDKEGMFFEYKFGTSGKIDKEVQEVQKALFHEKQKIIENQLFGVDINPNSAQITRLRLWIELLKHSYYDESGAFVTMPNIDINIKAGNSLISRYSLHGEIDIPNIKYDIERYKRIVQKYKEGAFSVTKDAIRSVIDDLKEKFKLSLKAEWHEIKKQKELLAEYIREYGFNELSDELSLLAVKEGYRPQGTLFGDDDETITKAKAKQREKLLKYLTEISQKIDDKLNGKIYEDAFEWRFEFPEVLDDEGNFIGFDVVIGNPPYLSNKDICNDDKVAYDTIYHLSDDLYNYFFTLSFQIVKKGGLINYITSNTFMTINSKINIRRLLQGKKILEFMPVKNPFDEAAVEPVIVMAENIDMDEDYSFEYVDLRKIDFEPNINRYTANIEMYRNTPNQAFFTPTEQNIELYYRYISQSHSLLNEWWSSISTSKNIAKNEEKLEEYRVTLSVGDVTLLGLVTDGGQGLATANNGKYVGVRIGTKEADKTLLTRIEKLESFNKKHNQSYNIDELNEYEIRELFDRLKAEFGSNIFGQGYIYRIVSEDEIAELDTLDTTSKMNGIDGTVTYVPYDKGDRDGNQWYLETPFYINWSIENVDFLKNDKRARFQGYNYFFKEGFSWNNVLNPNSEYIKCRLKGVSINDVASMSLYPYHDNITAKYITVILNSYLMFKYLRDVVNNTVNLQINDFRQLPIIVPTKDELILFESVFDEAKVIKLKEFSQKITGVEAYELLKDIQIKVDAMVYALYGIEDERIVVEGREG